MIGLDSLQATFGFSFSPFFLQGRSRIMIAFFFPSSDEKDSFPPYPLISAISGEEKS